MVIFGGIRSIARVCECLVPFMALFYIFGCIVILGMNYDYIFPALKTIGTLAFTPGAAAGGLVGRGMIKAMQYGVARGLFSNESGMGSAPIAAAAAQTKNPVRQALVSSTGTFWDTVVVCAMTGLVLVTSIMKIRRSTWRISGTAGSSQPWRLRIPILEISEFCCGNHLLCVFYGACWAYYGERCVEYFAGKKACFLIGSCILLWRHLHLWCLWIW